MIAAFMALTMALTICLYAAAVISIRPSPDDYTTPKEPLGCRRHGLEEGESNLSNELNEVHVSSKGKFIQVQSLWIYPIKSCRGIEVEEAEIVATGLKYDRQYCFAQLHSPFPLSNSDSQQIASAHQWRPITQREFPLLSQVRVELWLPHSDDPHYHRYLPYVLSGGALVVHFPYQEDGLLAGLKALPSRLFPQLVSKPCKTFLIPYDPTLQGRAGRYPHEPLKIWKDTPISLNMGIHLPPELKFYLGVRNPLTLFRVDQPRSIFRCAPPASTLGYQPITGFADAYPINILSLASLQSLSALQPPGSPPLSFRRFRGNIALTDTTPFQEETWTQIQIGRHVFSVCCRCVRCGVPNIDPHTGVKHGSEPYKTLVGKRNVDEGSPKLGCLGMQLVPELNPDNSGGHGWIRVWDVVSIWEEGEHRYIEM